MSTLNPDGNGNYIRSNCLSDYSLTEAKIECIAQDQKDTTSSTRMPMWLMTQIREAIKDKKASLKKHKIFMNEQKGILWAYIWIFLS